MRKNYSVISFHKVKLLVTNDPEVLLHNKEENFEVWYLYFCQGMLTDSLYGLKLYFTK